MLSKTNNEYLSRVGPGAPMGELLRRFWFPGFLEEEIAEPDSPPIRLRLFGEDLVAFKDSDGRIGVIDNHCRHRHASLYFGRNEDCGLRCVYHGWKFDVDGNCVDIPSEPNPGKTLLKKAKLKSYPAVARNGVVWMYMGPQEKRPARLPEFEWARLGEMHRAVTKRLQRNNWTQAVEGGIDLAHISFLHSKIDLDHPLNQGVPGGGQTGDRHPVFHIEEVNHGLLIGARREAAEKYYWRITPFLLPFFQMIPGQPRAEDDPDLQYGGHAWVPIDDENTWTWSFGTKPLKPFTKEEQDHIGGKAGYWGPVDDNYMPLQSAENGYGLDRELQRTANFTGIAGIPNQDAAVQESMGTIVDRSGELLGTSDSAVVEFRKLMLRLARELEQGKEPAAASHGEWYNVRSVSIVLDRDVPWVEGAAHRFPGVPIKEAAE